MEFIFIIFRIVRIYLTISVAVHYAKIYYFVQFCNFKFFNRYNRIFFMGNQGRVSQWAHTFCWRNIKIRHDAADRCRGYGPRDDVRYQSWRPASGRKLKVGGSREAGSVCYNSAFSAIRALPLSFDMPRGNVSGNVRKIKPRYQYRNPELNRTEKKNHD